MIRVSSGVSRRSGDFRLTVRVSDLAGNSGELVRPFSRFTWRMALERAEAKAQELLQQDLPALVQLFLGQIPAEVGGALAAEGETDTDGWAVQETELSADLEHRVVTPGVAALDGGTVLLSYGDPLGRWACSVTRSLTGDPPTAALPSILECEGE